MSLVFVYNKCRIEFIAVFLNSVRVVDDKRSLEVVDTPNFQAFQSKVMLRNLRTGGNGKLSKFMESRVLQLG